jgi:uncharacterized membrane protein (DUF106 family)
MNNNEEVEIIALKKEMDEVGDKNLSKEKRDHYIFLRQKQKVERKQMQETLLKDSSKPLIGKFSVLLGLIPLIIIAFIVRMIISVGPKDYDGDCVIGRDSPDCLESDGSGHPLWNN